MHGSQDPETNKVDIIPDVIFMDPDGQVNVSEPIVTDDDEYLKVVTQTRGQPGLYRRVS